MPLKIIHPQFKAHKTFCVFPTFGNHLLEFVELSAGGGNVIVFRKTEVAFDSLQFYAEFL